MKHVIANWKMNLLHAEAMAFCDVFLANHPGVSQVEVGIAASATLLREVHRRVESADVRVYAQNAFHEPKGAFTGELSLPQLRDAGCGGVLLGHSERRHIFGETDEKLVAKLTAAWEFDVYPVLCIGETLSQRDAGFTLDILRQQLAILNQTGPGPLTIAYEPVWAIGTGRRAEAAQIEEVHAFIHDELWMILGDSGRELPILYGGSVTPENFEEILEIPHVDGGLVGGASLDPHKFLQLIAQAEQAS